jgi:uncharacterized protein YyaL (SSP411 family)
MMHRSGPSRVCIGLLAVLALPGAAWSLDDPAKAGQPPANRLSKETSPYLLLHAHNPVDWYPWGPEAFARAKAENKPVFLSVGYSACYWCHVMERESFMDAEIAKALNANYVCIKVDREERPDVDQVYMAALQTFGRGGWPMSLFLTPDGRPFFGGTYFAPRDREGASGFLTIVNEVASAYAKQREAIEKDANAVTAAARRRLKAASGDRKLALSRQSLDDARAQLAQQFDPEHGGFGFNTAYPRRPKFPEPVNLMFLLDQHKRGAHGTEASDPLKMVLMTLDRMARGGIRDQLGGGYHRYSTDRSWLVPHFEKMLYDNAQLASVHLAAYEITHDPRWRAEAEAIFAFVAAKLTAPAGGFYSSLDAETKGEEGAYYVWTRGQVQAALGLEAETELVCRVYGVAGEPNFEGERYVLHEPMTRPQVALAQKITVEELDTRLRALCTKLLAARETRPAPACDDKVLTGWNGLMIAGYADGFRVLKDETYRRAAEKAAGFVLDKMRTPSGGLLRTYRAGQAKLPAYLEDYAFLAHGLLRLFAATGDVKWQREARAIVDRMLADFEDREQGGFFFTAEGHEALLARCKDPLDGALPSGNSVAILDLLALHRLTGESSYREHAGKALGAFSAALSEFPVTMPLVLVGLEEYLGESSAKPAVADAAPPAAQKVVSASARVAGDATAAIAPGSEFDALVTVTIQKGWHINANPTNLPEMKPTSLELLPASEQSARLVNVAYPAGDAKVLGSLGTEPVAVYEGKVAFSARLRLADGVKPGPIELKLRLNYQACDDRLCQAPAKMEVRLAVTVGK